VKVAVIGANGQAGVDIVKAFAMAGHDVVGLTHGDIEISNLANVRRVIQGYDVVVNTAAMHVAFCEEAPGGAYLVNAIGPKNLAEVARGSDALLVHISTEQVFDGNSDIPYTEHDVPCPRTVYGSTKLAGEFFIVNSGVDYQILRTSALFGHSPTRGKVEGLNFVKLMLKLAKEKGVVKVVNDEFVAPTSTASLARQAVSLIQSGHYGIFHAVSQGSCSWYEFAGEIFGQTNIKVRLEIAPPASGFVRAKYGVMDGLRLRQLGLNVIGSWQDELKEYLRSKQ